MEKLLENEYIAGALVVLFCFLITEILKLPIKIATKRIKNEKVRYLVNTIILIIPFAASVSIYYLYAVEFNGIPFDEVKAIGYGASAVSLYEVIIRLFGKNKDSFYNKDEMQTAINAAQNVAEGDLQGAVETVVNAIKSVDEDDKEGSALDQFYKEIK